MPAATAFTVPTDDTVATPALLELHVGATVADVPSLYAAVAVTVVVAPTAREVAAALTIRLVAVTPDAVAVLSEELVPVCVDEVVVVGSVGDEFPPQVTVTTVAITVTRKPIRRVVTSISFHSRRRGDQFYSTMRVLTAPVGAP